MTNFIETKQSQGKCEEVIFIYDYNSILRFLNLILILTADRLVTYHFYPYLVFKRSFSNDE